MVSSPLTIIKEADYGLRISQSTAPARGPVPVQGYLSERCHHHAGLWQGKKQKECQRLAGNYKSKQT